MPSLTVENYVKAIYQICLSAGGQAATGQVAALLQVSPGTVTSMLKTLSESGLATYTPYEGVQLTHAGNSLALRVLRRHRLIEQFLVKTLELNWDEVHDEAEQLEHVVSDRLIDRIDEMLERPEVDPHGDPIPGPEGTIARRHFETLLTCPLHTRVTVRRVVDQDKAFLRFIESTDLKPGQAIQVEARDAAADSVSVRVGAAADRRITIGTRAASKLLVEVGG